MTLQGISLIANCTIVLSARQSDLWTAAEAVWRQTCQAVYNHMREHHVGKNSRREKERGFNVMWNQENYTSHLWNSKNVKHGSKGCLQMLLKNYMLNKPEYQSQQKVDEIRKATLCVKHNYMKKNENSDLHTLCTSNDDAYLRSRWLLYMI